VANCELLGYPSFPTEGWSHARMKAEECRVLSEAREASRRHKAGPCPKGQDDARHQLIKNKTRFVLRVPRNRMAGNRPVVIFLA